MVKQWLVIFSAFIFISVLFVPVINANIQKNDIQELTINLYGANGITVVKKEVYADDFMEFKKLFNDTLEKLRESYKYDKINKANQEMKCMVDKLIELNLTTDKFFNEQSNKFCYLLGYGSGYRLTSISLSLLVLGEMIVPSLGELGTLIFLSLFYLSLQGLRMFIPFDSSWFLHDGELFTVGTKGFTHAVFDNDDGTFGAFSTFGFRGISISFCEESKEFSPFDRYNFIIGKALWVGHG